MLILPFEAKTLGHDPRAGTLLGIYLTEAIREYEIQPPAILPIYGRIPEDFDVWPSVLICRIYGRI
jgi:hypothetical protein